MKMPHKRGNPTSRGHNVVLSQQVVHPVGDESNTDKGNPARLRVPQNPSSSIVPGVVHPSVGKARGGADVVKK